MHHTEFWVDGPVVPSPNVGDLIVQTAPLYGRRHEFIIIAAFDLGIYVLMEELAVDLSIAHSQVVSITFAIPYFRFQYRVAHLSRLRFRSRDTMANANVQMSIIHN